MKFVDQNTRILRRTVCQSSMKFSGRSAYIHKLAVSVAVAVACGFVTASHADQVDDYLREQMSALHIPGLSVAVTRDGKIIKSAGYGFANLELSAHASQETVYEIGSMTKQFTAMAVLMLVQEGKISLDDGIRKFFPEAPEAWRDIKVRHLLSHTSGIQNHVAAPGFMDIFKTSLNFDVSPSRQELLTKFFALP